MSILVTGGTGFLGANVCYQLLKHAGTQVIAYDVVHRVPKFFEQAERDTNYVFVQGGIDDQWHLAETVKKFNVTDIVHTATLNTNELSLKRPYAFIKTNVLGAVNVLEVARLFGLRRVICISSRAAYGGYAPEEGPLREDFLLRPTGFYGASKASVDLILPLYRTHYGVDAVSIRPTGIFGPGQGEAGAGVASPIYNMLKCVMRGEPYSLTSGGDHYLESTYVKELVRGIELILEAKRVNHAIYTISYGKLFKVREMAEMIRLLIPEAKINIGPGLLEGIAPRPAMDTSRAREEFGYIHSPLKDCIADFIAYLRSLLSG